MFDKERFEDSICYTILIFAWLVVIGCGVAFCIVLDVWLHIVIIVGIIFIIWLIVYIVMTVKNRFKERR